MRTLHLLALLMLSVVAHAEQPVRVFAAASLTNALNDIGAEWQKAGHPKPSLAYGASTWMDYLERRGWIQATTRANLLGNALVLIVPKGKRFKMKMQPDFDL